MRNALSLVLTLAVLSMFFPAAYPKIEAVLAAFLDLALQVFSAAGRLAGA